MLILVVEMHGVRRCRNTGRCAFEEGGHVVNAPVQTSYPVELAGGAAILQRVAAVPGRVLVVDDDESIRLLIHRLLARSGFAVETASDGGVALDMISKDGYDALVLDLMMPHIDGFTVLRQLIETNPELVSRTVVATAYP